MKTLLGATPALGVMLSIANVLLANDPSFAQVLQPGALAPGLAQLLSNPAGWLTDMFNAALVSISQRATGDMVGFMNWLMGSGNVINQTPALLSYNNQAVIDLWQGMRTAADLGLGAVTVWGGLNVIINRHIRTPYHGVLELLPRVVLCGIMINSSLYWGRFVIELNNVLCQYIGSSAMPGWGDVQQPPQGGEVLLNLIAMAIYLVLGLLLMGQMLMRVALVDALLVIGPLALLCWVLPQTYSWARLWFTTFFATVFVQAIQVLVLRLGADLVQRLPSMLPSLGAGSGEGWQIWLTTLLLGMAVLQLTRKIPRLMPGATSGVGAAYTGPTIRQIGAFFDSGKNQKNQRGGR